MEISNINNNMDNLMDIYSTKLAKRGNEENTARTVGNMLESAQDKYLNALSSPSQDPGKIASLEISYRRSMQAYNSFLEVTRSMFQIYERAISRLAS